MTSRWRVEKPRCIDGVVYMAVWVGSEDTWYNGAGLTVEEACRAVLVDIQRGPLARQLEEAAKYTEARANSAKRTRMRSVGD